jgi:hypothetical protein
MSSSTAIKSMACLGSWSMSKQMKSISSAHIDRLNASSNKSSSDVTFVPVPIPMIAYDYPQSVNPHLFEVTTLTLEWVRSYGQVFEFPNNTVHDFLLVAVYAYPTATLRQLFSAIKLLLWGFAIDDHVLEQFTDRSEIVMYTNRFMDILESNDRSAAADFSLYCSMLLTILDELKPSMSDAQQQRFRFEVQRYFEGTIDELTLQSDPNVSISEYIRIRENCVAGGLYELLVELFTQADMSRRVECALFKRNKLAVNHLLGWQNDLYSLNKELYQQSNTNLVCLVHRRQKLPIEVAVERVARQIWTEKTMFDETAASLVNKYQDDPKVLDYVIGLRHWIQANLKSSIYCPRYYRFNRFQ